jgi:hypothetical protein
MQAYSYLNEPEKIGQILRGVLFSGSSERNSLAIDLSMIVIDLIWCHEIGHVKKGHLDYANQELGIRVLHEHPMNESEEVPSFLEIEADGYAIHHVIGMAAGKEYPVVGPKFAGLAQDRRCALVVIMCYLLSYLWQQIRFLDIAESGSDPYTMGTHLTPEVRSWFFTVGAYRSLQAFGVTEDLAMETVKLAEIYIRHYAEFVRQEDIGGNIDFWRGDFEAARRQIMDSVGAGEKRKYPDTLKKYEFGICDRPQAQDSLSELERDGRCDANRREEGVGAGAIQGE